MQTTLLPKDTCLKLESLIRKFVWHTHSDRSWSVCFQFFKVINHVKTEATNTCFSLMKVLDEEKEYRIHITLFVPNIPEDLWRHGFSKPSSV